MRTLLSRSGQSAGGSPEPRSGGLVPSGGRALDFRTVRLIDLPQHDTRSAPIEKRLTAFLIGVRQRRLLLAYFRDLREREQVEVPAPAYDEEDFADLRQDLGLRRYSILPVDLTRIKRRAEALAKRRHNANGLDHLKDDERERLKGLLGEVPAAVMPSEHRADETAAALHEEMPWMAPATEAAWHALRRSARLGEPVRVGPLVLTGPPGVGKTAWARRLAAQLAVASTVIDASQGLASFSLTGQERGWTGSQPGRPLGTMIDNRIANPVIIVDEICKASSPVSSRGVSAAFLPALLGLLEPESAQDWHCPYFKVQVDMRHLSWVMLANTLGTVPEPVLSRARVLPIPDVTLEQLQGFARAPGQGDGAARPGHRRHRGSAPEGRRPAAAPPFAARRQPPAGARRGTCRVPDDALNRRKETETR